MTFTNIIMNIQKNKKKSVFLGDLEQTDSASTHTRSSNIQMPHPIRVHDTFMELKTHTRSGITRFLLTLLSLTDLVPPSAASVML